MLPCPTSALNVSGLILGGLLELGLERVQTPGDSGVGTLGQRAVVALDHWSEDVLANAPRPSEDVAKFGTRGVNFRARKPA